jgi:ATP-dependent DNA helicase
MAFPQPKAKPKPSKPTTSKTKSKAKAKPRTSITSTRSGRKIKPIVISDSESDNSAEEEEKDDNEEDEDEYANFPIVLTTYEMIIKDRLHLSKYDWGYIVVDEGHRLKNLNCALMREIKKYKSAGRMILTGTPLHVSVLARFLIFTSHLHSYNRTTSQNSGPS